MADEGAELVDSQRDFAQTCADVAPLRPEVATESRRFWFTEVTFRLIAVSS
jgi:hypothetical protein